jgi:hypothetical protein
MHHSILKLLRNTAALQQCITSISKVSIKNWIVCIWILQWICKDRYKLSINH